MELKSELKLTITRIEEATDNENCIFLKCKGYSPYKTTTSKGTKITAYNSFSTIRLYPVNENQYTETKERLFSQTELKPKLKVVAYESDLTTNIIGGQIRPIITVTRYDFEKDKLFRKNKLLSYGRDE